VSKEKGADLAPERKPSGFSHLVLHLHPRLVPTAALPLQRTYGLGGAAAVLFLVLVVTGAPPRP
jgi:hypothetical protein